MVGQTPALQPVLTYRMQPDPRPVALSLPHIGRQSLALAGAGSFARMLT